MRVSDLHKRILAGQKNNFLLDDYPNSSAAYSLRKLRSAYTGNCIEVRRSLDGATQNIGFVNNVLDTSSLLSFVGAGDGFVRTWYDQSGNAKNATQTTTANQPRIVNSGIIDSQNNKPAIFFNGTSNFFIVSDQTFGNIADNISVFAIVKLNFSGYYPTIISKAYSQNGSYTLGTWDNTGVIQIWADGINYRDLSKANIINNQVLISNINLTGINGLKIYLNSSLYAQFTATTDLTGSNNLEYSIGRNQQDSNYYWNGTIQEIIPYGNNQSANRIAIESNINSFYNIFQ